ncbi:MAG: PLDc N-terminal domain-containing protein [Candidatus Omnitrophica bacterium]|nr:PLDc N-terminal domain-containing protein [Candidatus Omnitrophota bacterium]
MDIGSLARGISSIIVIAIAVVLFLFWAKMLIDCVRHSFSRPVYKVIWIFAIAVFQTVGAFVYWLMVYRKA